ncbi:amidohydrolase family protein [Streptomyces sp. NPDC023327]|uniref:metal-dependent hydrolase family protein n=1 Tax=Streptomyces sp. NPDC023327 TaxID=3157088 RepID=UPI0033EB7F24
MNGQVETLVVRASRHWDGVSATPGGPVEVHVRDGSITYVGPRGDGRLADAPVGEVVELGARMLLPGFIDCHVHVVDPALSHTTPSHQALGALPALRTLLDNGFTTVRDLGCTGHSVTVDLRQAVQDGIVVGPRMIVAPHMLSSRGGHGDKSGELAAGFGVEVGTLADGPLELTRAVRVEVRLGADWVKFSATGGFSSDRDEPTQTTYTQTEMDALVACAEDMQRPCAVHAMTDQGIRRAVRAGVRSVEHANLATPETFDLLTERGVWLVPTRYVAALLTEQLDNDDYWQDKEPELRDKIRRHTADLRERAGHPGASQVRIAFGTDAGVVPYEDTWREFPAMVDAGITPLRALRAATGEAAALLGRDDIGRIAPGTAADLIALDGDPFTDIHATGRIAFVLRRGAVHRRPPSP